MTDIPVKLGVEKLQIEKILQDDSTDYVTDTPIDLSDRLYSVMYSPNNLEAKVNADNAVRANFFSTPGADIEIVLAYLTPAEETEIFNMTNVGAIRAGGDSSNIPYYLVKWTVTDGAGKTYWELLKVKFVPGEENAETVKDGSIDPQMATLKGTAIKRSHKPTEDPTANPLYYKISDQDALYDDEGDTWYSQGDNLATPDLVAPTIDSTTPAADAVDIAVSANYVWVFDKGILSSCMTAGNFFVVKDSDGSAVAGALSLSTSVVANDTVTLNPTANLTASTAYRAICTINVKSKTGIALAANSVRKFTTAA